MLRAKIIPFVRWNVRLTPFHAITRSCRAGQSSLEEVRRDPLYGKTLTHMRNNEHTFKRSYTRFSASASSKRRRFISNSVSLNVANQTLKLELREIQGDELIGLPQYSQAVQVNGDASAEAKDIVLTQLEVTILENVGRELPSTSNSHELEVEKWWHIPDFIEEVLPVPADLDQRLEVLFESFGDRIDSRELLLRVLVHKSYYDLHVPLRIKDREYVKPINAMFINSGEVKLQPVEGLPSQEVPFMTFCDAHGEVRSQLAILGDAVVGLAVASLLVRQHSSAGKITERKGQLVSNSNLSRVWRNLLGPQDFVLSSGNSSSQDRMMADTCEAYIGAIYTEKGFERAFDCVNNVLLPLLVQANSARNAVHALNVQSSMAFQVLPEYRSIGIDNENTQHQVCRVRVYVKGIRMATGMGRNQKLARVDAAQKALEKWSTVFPVP